MKTRQISAFRRGLFLSSCVLLASGGAVFAQDSFGGSFLDPGTFELSLSATGSWSREEGLGLQSKTIGGNIALGFFLTNWLEVGAKAEGSYREEGPEEGLALDEVSTVDVFGGPVLTLNFPVSRVVPFVTASIGPLYQEARTSGPGGDSTKEDVGWYWDAGGGFRIFFAPYASLNLMALYRMIVFDDRPDRNNIVGMAGISLFF